LVSNKVEVKARGAEVIEIAYENDVLDESILDKVIRIPELLNLVSPIVAVVALQLLAYYTARNKGCDIDKPRNLAKSVTVE
jgi:glucosamine--fructose-6-phosphate aminotransferase (isomerizing)